MEKKCPKCGNLLKDTAKFCNKCGIKYEEINNETNGGKHQTNEKKYEIRDIIGGLIAIIFAIYIVKSFIIGDPTDTPEAAVALRNAEVDMGSGFKASEIEFDVVDAKDDIKFIIKCEAVSDEAKEMYIKLYGDAICYYGMEMGAGSEYFYSIGESESEVKEKMDW